MTNRYVIAMIATTLLGGAIPAIAADGYTTYDARCVVQVRDTKYDVDGPCSYVVGPRILYFAPSDVSNPSHRLGVMAVRIKADGTGLVVFHSPNRLGGFSSIATDYGDVNLDLVTSCWANDYVRICAYDKAGVGFNIPASTKF